MKCKYIYNNPRPDGTEEVKIVKGLVKVGDECRSQFGSVQYDGFCWRHAIIMGKVKEEKIREMKEKQSEYARKRYDKRRSLVVERYELNKFLGEMAEMADTGFNAIQAYRPIRVLNPLPRDVNGVEKFLFALWLLSSKETRVPEDMEGFSRLTNVKLATLQAWARSSWIEVIWREERKRFMFSHGHLVDRVVLSKALNGDTGCLRMYYEMFPIEERKKIKAVIRDKFKANPEAQRMVDEMVSDGLGGDSQVPRPRNEVSIWLEDKILKEEALTLMEREAEISEEVEI